MCLILIIVITIFNAIMKHKFNIVAQRNADDLLPFVEKIVRLRPDLAKATFTHQADGTCADVLLTETEAFKTAADGMAREIRIQRALAAAGLPVPAVTCVAADNSLFGMTRLQGMPLRDIFNGLPASAHQKIARQLGGIKAGISTVVDAFDDAMVDPYGDDRFIAESRDIMDTTAMREAMTPEAGQAVSLYLDQLGYRRDVLLHGDLHGGNIIVNPATADIVGVIDFGLAKRSRLPEAEPADFPEDFQSAMIESYAEKNTRGISGSDFIICEFLRSMKLDADSGSLEYNAQFAASYLKKALKL